ncbi:MAG: hypothetical protein P4L87_07865 [Formivibrio sp.]|nr:hypothetical protein [Formivibrio sp.]
MQQQRGAQADHYFMAGLPVSVCFLDENLRRQAAPAFQHLRTVEPSEPELTVYVAGALPQFADLPRQLTALGLGELAVLSLRLDGMELMVHRQGHVIGALDAAGRNACWLVLSATGMAYLDQAAPMHPLLSHWFAGRDRYLFHGAAVGVAGKGVVILGNGGAGKSTTALACLEAGMQFVGDDRCLLSMAEVPAVYSLYGTAKLIDTARFPILASDVDRKGMEKDEKAMYRLRRGELQQRFQLQAILLAQIEDRLQSKIQPLNAKRGYLGLASSAALHLPQFRRAALRCFNEAARRLPVYALKLGSDIRSTPVVVRQLLFELH